MNEQYAYEQADRLLYRTVSCQSDQDKQINDVRRSYQVSCAEQQPTFNTWSSAGLNCERLLDLEQQKKFLRCINDDLKKRVVTLEGQKTALAEVIQCSTVHIEPAKSSGPNHKIYALALSAVLIGAFAVSHYLIEDPPTVMPMKTKYLTENLRGDSVDTWKFWNVDSERTLVVGIANSAAIDKNKLNIIKDAILSERTLSIDNSITHKGPAGSASIYFAGWRGALEKASETKTKNHIPTKFRIIESDNIGDIIITLSSAKDQDGYSGFTKSTVDGDQILQSHITIYDADGISDDALGAVVRHEFGHALGLGHSTAPEDLMAPDISMQIPYVSGCDINALDTLYDGNAMASTVCEK